MEYVISAVWIFLELINFVTFSDAFLHKRRGRNQTIIAILFAWVLMYVGSRLFLNEVVKLFLTMCAVIGLSLYLFRGSFWHHVLYTLLAYSIIAVIDVAVVYGISAALSISYSELVWRQLLYTVIGTIAKLLCVLVAHIIRLLRKTSRRQRIKSKWLLLIILFPAISVLMIVVVSDSYSSSADLSIGAFVFSCILAVANIAILYLISAMEKSTEKEKELVLINQQMEIQTKSILALEKSYRAQRRATHEYNHQLQTIQNLLANEKSKDALKYVEQLQGVNTLRISNVDTHHPIIDAVLNQKYQEARERSIEMHIQINDLSGITVKQDALVVLLSNLLDNAIEACMRLPCERTIHCTVLANDCLFISIKNTSLPVTIIDGLIPTSKEVKGKEHGFGLISIYHILNTLNAEYTLRYEDGWFQFVTEIPDAAI